jgi:hypothetical protein
MTAAMRTTPLRIAATAETATLAALLLNLLTVHAEPVSSLLGPLHGTAYLAAIATAPTPRARRYAAIPGIGGLLALRQLRAAAPDAT